MVIRVDDLRENMSEYLVCRIEETPNIEVRKRTEGTGMDGDKWLETVCLKNRETGQQVAESGAWPLQRQPFLLETTVPGVFAAGDVRHGSIKHVDAAVGEGSMAVQFVHQFLADSPKEIYRQQPTAA